MTLNGVQYWPLSCIIEQNSAGKMTDMSLVSCAKSIIQTISENDCILLLLFCAVYKYSYLLTYLLCQSCIVGQHSSQLWRYWPHHLFRSGRLLARSRRFHIPGLVVAAWNRSAAWKCVEG